MTKDLTKGTPWKVMVQFGLPLLIGNLIQQVYSMADTVMVGNALGVNALAAVGSTGAITFFVLGFCNGMGSGFAVPIAQAFGAKDEKLLRKNIGNAILWGAVVSIVITALSLVFCSAILKLMRTPEDIFRDTWIYTFTIFAGIFTTMLYNMSAGILRAVGDSKTPLIFLVVSGLLNVFFNYLFLFVFPLGVFGAAFATVLAQLLSGAACVVVINTKYKMLRIHLSDLKPDWRITGKQFAIGLPMAMQFSITAIGSMMIQGSVNNLGTAVVAANTAAQKVTFIAMMPIMAEGTVLSTYAAQNLGAAQYERIRTGVRQSYVIMAIFTVFGVVFSIALGTPIMRLFSSELTAEEIHYGMVYIVINSAGLFLFAILHIFRNVLQGLGISLVPFFGGVMELFARVCITVICAALFGKIPTENLYMIISFASAFAWICADLTLIVRYLIFGSRLKKQIADMEAHPEKRRILSIKEL